MKKELMIFACSILFSVTSFSQKYFSKTGEISFFSSTPIEDIKAVSNSASTVFDLSSGNIQWAVLIKSFQFDKALMQEHFNENYMESSKYPKAVFKGAISNLEDINLSKDGTYETTVKGVLEIHGEKKEISTKATFKVEDGQINATSNFKVLVADYGIEIPSVVKDNIAKEIDIKIKTNYEVFDKS